MEHETYYATMAQLLPVMAIAAVVELKWYFRAWRRAQGHEPLWWIVVVGAWGWVLAACVCALILTIPSCALTLWSGDGSSTVHEVHAIALPLATGLMILPIIGIVAGRRDDSVAAT